MNQKLYGGVLALVLSFLVSFPATAVDLELAEDSTLNGVLERGKLRVGFEVGYLPFEMIDKRGGLRQRFLRPGDERRGSQHASFIGFDIDIAREMAKALGVDFAPVNTRWTSIMPALNLGRFDIIISGMSITEERKGKVDFSDPYMTIGQTVLLNKKHEGVISSYEQLNDPQYTVTSKPGTTGEEAVQKLLPKATYQPFDTELQAATEVLEGRADAFIYDLPYNVTFYAMQGSENLGLLDDPFTTESLAWAIRKNDPDFLKWLNGFLMEIKEDGRYEKIYNKWFKSNEWFKYIK